MLLPRCCCCCWGSSWQSADATLPLEAIGQCARTGWCCVGAAAQRLLLCVAATGHTPLGADACLAGGSSLLAGFVKGAVRSLCRRARLPFAAGCPDRRCGRLSLGDEDGEQCGC